MKKIQTIDFDLKDNIIKNLKQLLKKLLVENIDIFYEKKIMLEYTDKNKTPDRSYE